MDREGIAGGCRKCKRTEDWFGMLEYVCKRNIKQIIDAISIAEYGLQPTDDISVCCTIAVKLNGIVDLDCPRLPRV